jgi:hypothetical protein
MPADLDKNVPHDLFVENLPIEGQLVSERLVEKYARKLGVGGDAAKILLRSFISEADSERRWQEKKGWRGI